MATLTLSGYLAAATAVVFSGTQTLVSLVDNEWTDLSDEIDNSTNKYALADLDLILASAVFTGADSGIEVFVVPTVDGTTYPTWTGNSTADAQEQEKHFVAFLPLKAATQAQRAATPAGSPVALPQGKFKFGVRNRGNVTLASSGNTLYWRPHSLAI